MQLCTTATNFSPLFSSDSEQTQKPEAAEDHGERGKQPPPSPNYAWTMVTKPWFTSSRSLLRPKMLLPMWRKDSVRRRLPLLASSGTATAPVAPACSAILSRFKSINHVLRETYRPLQWRTTTKEYTGSLANRQKVTAQLALVAQISLLLEANGTDATRKPLAITTKQDEDYQNNLDDAVGHMFFRMDEQLREDDEWRALANPCHRFSFNLLKCLKAPACVKGTPYSEGSTASVALISGNRIIVGSAGDSRCVLSRNGQAMDEHRRIQNAGGQVTWDRVHFRCATRFQLGSYGVNGDLAMSRSIGDFHFKSNCLPATEQIVTCNPDVCTVVITDDTEFLLIASDGIWDMFSSQGAVNFVHQKLASGTTGLHTICDGLLDHYIKSRDNMTVILVQFKPAARIPLPAPATVMPAAQPSASETSSGTSSVIKEDPPASFNNA